MVTLEQLNSFSDSDAQSNFEKCCVSSTWISKMIKSRPFNDYQDVINKAANIWYQECSQKDFLEAFTGHPKIGNVESLKEKFAKTKEWAEMNSQKLVMQA